MHVDLYAANEDLVEATQDLLNLLREEGVQAQPSIVTGGVICQVGWDFREAFLKAIPQWSGQLVGRSAKPKDFKFVGTAGENTTVTITVHPSQAAATAS